MHPDRGEAAFSLSDPAPTPLRTWYNGVDSVIAAGDSQVQNNLSTRVVDKKQILQWLRQWREQTLGIPDNPGASPESARQKLLQAGIHPEKNELSTLILHERYGDEK